MASSTSFPSAATPGNIIILNGASSSGKTTLLKALQKSFDEPYLEAGIDKFLWMLPGRYLDVPLWHEVFAYTWLVDGGDSNLLIRPGPRGYTLLTGMHHAIAALARAGNHVLADHVLIDPRWVQECARLFCDLPAWFVGVRCPLEVLEAREKTRNNRTLGQARAQYPMVHAHGLYDIEVDTSLLSLTECVDVIKQRVLSGTAPTAFRRLAS
jgi:chloramphenicol 3-O phosphotransferase